MEEVVENGGAPQVRPPASFGHIPTAPQKKRGILVYILVIFLVVFGFCAMTSITYSAEVFGAYNSLLRAQSEAEQLKISLKAVKVDDARAHLQAIDRALSDTNAALSYVNFTKSLPLIGPQFMAGRHVLLAGTQMVHAGLEVLKIGEAVQNALPLDRIKDLKSMKASDREKLLAVIHNAAPQLDGARTDLELAKEELKKIPPTGIFRQIKKVENQLQVFIPQVESALDTGTALSKVIPDFVGYPKEKRYLVLFLNNTELRPGGGFIGSFGILRVKSGEIVEFTVRDSWDLDNAYKGTTTPPPPINKYLVQNLEFRDANWSPNFPTSAQTQVDFYRKESGDKLPLDGVIGLTPDVIHGLLQLTGPIQVKGYPYTFTAENFNTTLENAVEYDFIKLGLTVATRKQILGDLNKTIMERILSLPREKWPHMLDVLGDSVRDRYLMVYLTSSFADRDVMNQVMKNYNWDGRMLTNPGDFVMLVDANFYGLKTDPVVQRRVDYTVHWKSPTEAVARAVLTYKHTGFLSRFIDAYQTYIRLFVPEGAKLVSSSGTKYAVETVQEDGRTSFGFFERIEPQQTRVYVLEYKLPKSVLDELSKGSYSLTVQKELGGYTIPFSATFQGPKEIGMIQAGDASVSKLSNQQVTLSQPITSDAYFHLTF